MTFINHFRNSASKLGGIGIPHLYSNPAECNNATHGYTGPVFNKGDVIAFPKN